MTYKTGEEPRIGDTVSIDGVVVDRDDSDDSVLLETGAVNSGKVWIAFRHVILISRAEPPCVTFEVALAAYRRGKWIRRKGLGRFALMAPGYLLTKEDVVAEDWQIYEPEVRR